LQLLEVNVESERDFASAIALEPERRQGRRVPAGCRWPPALHYSQHVHYVEQLREYHEHFGRERVLALIYDDFRADNEAVVRQVFRFLGIDDAAPIAQTEANPTVRVRASRVHGLVHDAALGRGAVLGATKTAVKAITPARLRRGALRTVNRAVLDDDPPAPDEQLMLELRRRFKDEVIAASAYLDRDLVTLWGYDRID
ncbi:MAG TPA: sulfotransferase domain-containing protein, partial [Solirubrobacteraceae bacterium]|nr:sulfotransferase domain-containing protein [Solirubrobacteraceae bacterium]